MAGVEPTGQRRSLEVSLNGLRLPFVAEGFQGREGSFVLYHLAWNLTEGVPLDGSGYLGWRQRWREVSAGRSEVAVREIAVAIFGRDDPAQADREFRREIAAIVSRPGRA